MMIKWNEWTTGCIRLWRLYHDIALHFIGKHNKYPVNVKPLFNHVCKWFQATSFCERADLCDRTTRSASRRKYISHLDHVFWKGLWKWNGQTPKSSSESISAKLNEASRACCPSWWLCIIEPNYYRAFHILCSINYLCNWSCLESSSDLI